MVMCAAFVRCRLKGECVSSQRSDVVVRCPRRVVPASHNRPSSKCRLHNAFFSAATTSLQVPAVRQVPGGRGTGGLGEMRARVPSSVCEYMAAEQKHVPHLPTGMGVRVFATNGQRRRSRRAVTALRESTSPRSARRNSKIAETWRSLVQLRTGGSCFHGLHCHRCLHRVALSRWTFPNCIDDGSSSGIPPVTCARRRGIVDSTRRPLRGGRGGVRGVGGRTAPHRSPWLGSPGRAPRRRKARWLASAMASNPASIERGETRVE